VPSPPASSGARRAAAGGARPAAHRRRRAHSPLRSSGRPPPRRRPRSAADRGRATATSAAPATPATTAVGEPAAAAAAAAAARPHPHPRMTRTPWLCLIAVGGGLRQIAKGCKGGRPPRGGAGGVLVAGRAGKVRRADTAPALSPAGDVLPKVLSAPHWAAQFGPERREEPRATCLLQTLLQTRATPRGLKVLQPTHRAHLAAVLGGRSCSSLNCYSSADRRPRQRGWERAAQGRAPPCRQADLWTTTGMLYVAAHRVQHNGASGKGGCNACRIKGGGLCVWVRITRHAWRAFDGRRMSGWKGGATNNNKLVHAAC